jgi:hypothetical protein
MGNNGGVGEITDTNCMGFLMHSSHWPSLCSPLIGREDHAFVMHFSYSSLIGRAHALLSLAELVMHFSCNNQGTT